MNEIRKENGQSQIAIDGKTLSHSFTEKPINALHAESGLEMLSALNIKGAHITVYAINTQKTIADKSLKVVLIIQCVSKIIIKTHKNEYPFIFIRLLIKVNT